MTNSPITCHLYNITTGLEINLFFWEPAGDRWEKFGHQLILYAAHIRTLTKDFVCHFAWKKKSNGEPKLLKTAWVRLKNCYKATVFLNTHVMSLSLVRRWWFLLSYFEWNTLSTTTFKSLVFMARQTRVFSYFFKTWFFNFVAFRHW